MIFVTVGSQMAFDRLISAVDAWAGRTGRSDVFAQIGPSDLRPLHVQYAKFIEPMQFQDCLDLADAIIAHAGMGTIIGAVERGKPILVVPRRGDLSETRNDHQVSTAQRFRALGLVETAMDDAELLAKLDAIEDWRVRVVAARQTRQVGACPLGDDEMCTAGDCGMEDGCPRLLEAVKKFVTTGAVPKSV